MIIVRYSIVCIWRARVKAAENVIAPGMIYHHPSWDDISSSQLYHPSWQTHMGLIWDPYRHPYGPHMGSPHGTRMGFANGIGMGPIWVFDMGPIWVPRGSHMGPRWVLQTGLIWVFDMGPIWVPDWFCKWDW